MNEVPSADTVRYPLEFTGQTGEYFRIWIVNLALTIVTLGIYSAWAKVRRKRYFYGHTFIDRDAFEYRANPIAILKGRLIALAVVAVLWSVNHFAPMFFWVPLIAAVFVFPWLLVRSFAFNAHNTAFRNIRMHFRGTYWGAFKVFVGYGLLTVITLGLGWFWLRVRLTEFVIRNFCYGTAQFEVPDLKKSFFQIYGHAIGLGILLGLFASGLVFLLGRIDVEPDSVQAQALEWIFLVLVYVAYLFIFAYVRAGIQNASWNQATLGSIRFVSTLKVLPLFTIYLVNIVAIVLTLGLATPWAVIRTLRYRAENLTLLSAGELEGFVAAESTHVSAAGEEVGEMLDFDFSL